jgi:hypothetical protein
MKRVVLPLKASGPRSVLNSECNFLVNPLNKIIFLLGISQKTGVTITTNMIALTQFSEVLKIAAGSNTENRFVIIFN